LPLAPRILAALPFVAILSVPGCNIVGPAYVLIHGPEKAQALHTLEKGRPTIVFVDDRASVLPRRSTRLGIAEAAQEALLAEGALVDVIDARNALATAARETPGDPMDIAAIGRGVQAEVVIYVAVDAFELSADGQSFLPSARARVKVLDVTKTEGARLWPAEREGHPIVLQLPVRTGELPRTPAEVAAAEAGLAQQLGVAVGRLFFDYEVRTPVSERNK